MAEIKNLLLSRDLDQIREGVAQAVALDDVDVWARLLDGVTWTPATTIERPGGIEHVPGRLQPNRMFTWNTVSQPWNEMALAMLVAASPLPLRDEVTSLELKREDWRADPSFRFALDSLDRFPNLEWLAVTNVADVTPLGTFPALKRLALTRARGLVPSIPTLEELDCRMSEGGWADGATWPKLQHVNLLNVDLAGLVPGAPNIETLTATWNGGRDDDWTEVAIKSLPWLKKLHLRGALVRIDECPKLAELSLVNCAFEWDRPLPSVTTLGLTNLYPASFPAEAFPNVTELTTSTIPFTARIEVPSGARVPDGVFTVGRQDVEDLGNLGELANLEVLDLSSGSSVRVTALSLETLRNAQHLRAVRLRNMRIDDLSPLIGLPELRHIDARDTGITKADVPPELAKIVKLTKKQHDLNEARNWPHPNAVTPGKRTRSRSTVPAAARPTITKLKKLLFSRDPAAIAQGVELTAALDDPDVWRALLDGVTYDPNAILPARKGPRKPLDDVPTVGRFIPNKLFTGSSHPAEVWQHDLALVALVALCPIPLTGAKEPLRDAVVGLTLGDWFDKSRTDVELSMRHMAGFPNLQQLQLFTQRPVTHIDELTNCPCLTEVHIVATAHDVMLPALPSLKRLTINREKARRQIGGFSAIVIGAAGDGWPELEEATLVGDVDDWAAALDRMPKLRKLTSIGHAPPSAALGRSSVADLSFTAQQRGVPYVLSGCEALTSVDVLTAQPMTIEDLPNLTSLAVQGWGAPDTSVHRCEKLAEIQLTATALTGLVGLDALRQVTVDRVQPGVEPDPITELVGVTEFSFTPTGRETTVGVPPGATPTDGWLDLSAAHELTDVGNVASLAGLRGLLVNARGVASVEALRTATDLQVLDIRRTAVSDLSPLVDLPNLATIYVAQSDVTDIPAALQETVNFAAKPNLKKIQEDLSTGQLGTRPAPKKTSRVPVKGVGTADWQRLLTGLSTDDLDAALEAADFAKSLGPDVVEYLLSRVDLGREGRTIRTRVPFRLADVPLRVSMVARLLTHADPASPAGKKLKTITELSVAAKKLGLGVMSLDDLHVFPNLTRLDISKCAAVTSADLSKSSVEVVKIRCRTIENFRAGPMIRVLQLQHHVPDGIDLSSLAGGPLEQLVCSRFDASTLAGCQNLRELFAIGQVDNPEALLDLPLTTLYTQFEPVESWAGHPTLKKIYRIRRFGRRPTSASGASSIPVQDLPDYRSFDVDRLPT